MRDLTGKVAWVTGGGTGIGAASAEALAGAGMKVVLCGRRAEPLQEVAAAITAKGGAARIVALDVADADAVQATAEEIGRLEGRVDVLVNSAGLNVRRRNWRHLRREDWEQVIRIDLDGAFYCCHAVLPMMRKQGEGLIVNISSIAGRSVSAMTGPAYSAAKFGMNAFTESLNIEECINGIRATSVMPGEVATPILDKRPIPVSAEDKARMVQAEDCGELVLFLARMPAHVCINDVTISPTWNRAYVGQARGIPAEL
jgi:NADP-dependent 3-hydroxy acid dehydrogenase YdfG